MNSLSWILVIFISGNSFASGRVRHVVAAADEIVTVKTALGIATIVQVPDRPNSLVVGDTEAFKVEYLDQAITIKPLHSNARSNLYIYTDWRRFNVQLVTGPEPTADYVVYLDRPSTEKRNIKTFIRWMPFHGVLKNDELRLKVNKLGRTADGAVLIDFSFEGSKVTTLKPEWIWITQAGAVKPIHRLDLSSLELGSGKVVHGIIKILKPDIDSNSPLKLELRRQKTSTLKIPGVNAWK